MHATVLSPHAPHSPASQDAPSHTCASLHPSRVSALTQHVLIPHPTEKKNGLILSQSKTLAGQRNQSEAEEPTSAHNYLWPPARTCVLNMCKASYAGLQAGPFPDSGLLLDSVLEATRIKPGSKPCPQFRMYGQLKAALQGSLQATRM